MVGTRSKKKETEDASPIITPDAPGAVRNLALGGRGGRHASGITQQKDEEVKDSNSWSFPCRSTRNDVSALYLIFKRGVPFVSPSPHNKLLILVMLL